MRMNLSKKKKIIVSAIFFTVLAGTGGYLLWRVNNRETLAEVPGLASNCYARCKRTSGDDPGHIIDAACTDPERCAGYTNENGGQSLCEYETVCDAEPAEVCGNGTCVSGVENVTSCPADCSVCGDNLCTGTGAENLTTCPGDCSVCGDNKCTGPETLATCPGDCSVCGDNKCTGSETAATCASDCVCKDLTWTNKPSGKYNPSREFPTITVTNTNSKSTTSTGTTIKLNDVAVGACSTANTETCYSLSNNTDGFQVVSITLFKGVNAIKVGTYALAIELPVDTGLCAQDSVNTSTSFTIEANAVVVVPETGILDGVMGKVYIGTVFVFLGVMTTQYPKINYAVHILGEKNKIVSDEKRKKREESRRNRFEKRFK